MTSTKFDSEGVRAVILPKAKEVLNEQVFNRDLVGQWASQILDHVLEELPKRFPAYRFATHCLILPKSGATYYTTSRCYCDANTDGMTSVRYENEALVCVISVYAMVTH
jgi:hypothetical protein